MNQKFTGLMYNLEEALLLLIAFTLPFYQQAGIVAIILLLITWVLQKKFILLSKSLQKNSMVTLWIGYFLLHLIGLLWTENQKYGWHDIEAKLSFLIFPMVMATTPVTEGLLSKIKKIFIAGNIIACFYCFANAISSYIQSDDLTAFFYTSYSALIHSTYFTFYLNLALLFLLAEVIYNWEKYGKSKKTIAVATILFMILNIIVLSARTAIFATLITLLIYSIVQIKRLKKGTIFLSISVVVVILLSLQITHFYNRYTQVEETVEHFNAASEQPDTSSVSVQNYNSTTSRIEFWKNALVVIKENLLFGVGTGDIKEELVEQYKKVDFQYGVINRFSPHNQFLHTGVILGIAGIILLLCCLLLPLQSAIANNNWLYVCFLFIILINAITESILERQNGIIFYAFFNSILFFNSTAKLNEQA